MNHLNDTLLVHGFTKADLVFAFLKKRTISLQFVCHYRCFFMYTLGGFSPQSGYSVCLEPDSNLESLVSVSPVETSVPVPKKLMLQKHQLFAGLE